MVTSKIIGSIEYLQVEGEDVKIPAKTDTGADSSAIWASDFRIEEDGRLSFVFFDRDSELYSGKRHFAEDFRVSHVRSSNGTHQIRYQTALKITVCGETFETDFNLSDRSRGRFPVLIGRHALENRFLVDVSKEAFPRPKNQAKSMELAEELKKDPHAFHEKYMNGQTFLGEAK